LADKAIDGHQDCHWNFGNPAINSLTHTNQQSNPWWKVEMPLAKMIHTVKIFNRLDCCGERLSGYIVRVGNDANHKLNPQCPGTHTGTKEVLCNL